MSQRERAKAVAGPASSAATKRATRAAEEPDEREAALAAMGIPLDDRVRAVLVATKTVEEALEAIYGWD